MEYIVNSKDSNAKLAKSIALGLFIGVTPIWGWQIVTTIGLAHLFKLNKFIAVTASNISLPPMLPFIIFLSYFIGSFAMGTSLASMEYSPGAALQWIKENLVQYLLGSLILGVALAAVFGSLSYLLLKLFRK